MTQDWALVQAILDYRNAQQAIAWIAAGEEGASNLAQHPALGTLMAQIAEAQKEAS